MHNHPTAPVLVLSDGERATLDARPAPSFYAPPRIGVDHADAPFTRCVTELYASVLSDLAPPQQAAANGSASGIASGTASAAAAGGGAAGGSSGGGSGGTEQRPLQILDLCSSWASHLPAPEALGGAQLRVVGHGLNGQELAANERLAEWFVQVRQRGASNGLLYCCWKAESPKGPRCPAAAAGCHATSSTVNSSRATRHTHTTPQSTHTGP